MIESQNEAILQHLRKGYSLTPLAALRKFRCFALNSRISDLRNKQGIEIADRWIKRGGKRYKSYFIEDIAA